MISMNEVLDVAPIADAAELEERESRIERAQRNAYYEIGLELRAIRDRKLYKVKRVQPAAGRYSFETFEEYVEHRWDLSYRRSVELIESAEAAEKMRNSAAFLPSRESHIRPLLKLESDQERASVWASVVEKHGHSITAKDVEAEVELLIAAKSKDWTTLTEWKALSEDDQRRLLTIRSDKAFNKQDNDSIEWAQWTWNPITGCLHECSYCYARDIAKRFFPQQFEPSIIPGRLGAPANTNVPDIAKRDISYRNVFACSMADLFGRWVPDQWIESVLDQVRDNPQWNFLFLTKFPKRMAEFKIPRNAWMGTTVDLQARVKAAEAAFEKVDCEVKWLSIEPMLQPLTFTRLELFDWVVIGGSSKSTQTPTWVPPLDWMVALHSDARKAGARIYYKANAGLSEELRIKEFPWQEPKARTLPREFMYLGKQD